MPKKKKLKLELPKVRMGSVIMALLALLLIAAAYDQFVSTFQSQINVLTAERDAAQASLKSYDQSMRLIDEAHRQEWEAHYQAMANALLLTDAFAQGGLKKSNEVYDEVTKYMDEAVKQKELIKEELKKHGIEPPPDASTEGA